MSPDIKVDIGRARSAAVTAAHGVSPAELKAIGPRVDEGHDALKEDRARKRQGFYDLYKDKATLSEVKKSARAFVAEGYENFVVLGIGGSALGISTLVRALKPSYYNLLSADRRQGRPRVFVMDNVDPESFGAMLELCPPEKTLFNVISKSGGTAETVSQLLIVLERLEKSLGKAAVKRHLVVTTGPSSARGAKSPLQHVKTTYGLEGFSVPTNIGGRYSVFSPVGMFPAAVLGIDVDALAAGCRAMDRRTSKPSLQENPAYLRAAVHYILSEGKGKSIAVMMPYSDRLRDVADWHRQLWAESLGKQNSLNGNKALRCRAQTPVTALGVTDQHSQLQLYLEGPNDKVITILEQSAFERSLKIPDCPAGKGGVGYLRAKTMNRLIASERKATADVLRDAGRPVIRITLPQVNEHAMGQLLYMLEVETAMAGRLFNVNAFDQPAVESIKVLARKYMGGKV